jgi:hypothetical protein
MTTQAFVCDALRAPFVHDARCTMGAGAGRGIALMFERV